MQIPFKTLDHEWADPGKGHGGRPPLFLDETEAQRAEKSFLETASPLISTSGSGSASAVRNLSVLEQTK